MNLNHLWEVSQNSQYNNTMTFTITEKTKFMLMLSKDVVAIRQVF